MAISLGGSRAGARGAARLGARAPVRAGAAVDTALLGLTVIGAVVLLALPAELRDRAASTLRRTAVAPLVELQRLAEVQRARYLSYDERVAQRGVLARDAADVTGLRAENDRLRRILALGSRLQWGFVSAEAIPNQRAGELAREPILQTFLLTQGERAGVAVFAPVVAPEGLVGMVEQVDPAMSMAITYAHTDFRVSAQTPDGTAFGIVQPHLATGANRALLEIRGVPFRSPLKSGQLVVSSGQGGTYPRGIPVGTVVREIQTAERWARTYLLQPAVNLGDVGAVLVLRKQRAVTGVDSVWTSLASADSAARRVAAAGDSAARDALLREAAARRAAFGATAADSAAPVAPDSAGAGAAPPAPAAGEPRAPTAGGAAAGAATRGRRARRRRIGTPVRGRPPRHAACGGATTRRASGRRPRRLGRGDAARVGAAPHGPGAADGPDAQALDGRRHLAAVRSRTGCGDRGRRRAGPPPHDLPGRRAGATERAPCRVAAPRADGRLAGRNVDASRGRYRGGAGDAAPPRAGPPGRAHREWRAPRHGPARPGRRLAGDGRDVDPSPGSAPRAAGRRGARGRVRGAA